MKQNVMPFSHIFSPAPHVNSCLSSLVELKICNEVALPFIFARFIPGLLQKLQDSEECTIHFFLSNTLDVCTSSSLSTFIYLIYFSLNFWISFFSIILCSYILFMIQNHFFANGRSLKALRPKGKSMVTLLQKQQCFIEWWDSSATTLHRLVFYLVHNLL